MMSFLNNLFAKDLKCPYCGNKIDKFPSRKTKCGSCGKYYFAKTTVVERKRTIVTEEQAENIEKQWTEYHHVEHFRNAVMGLYENERTFEKSHEAEKVRLKKKFGFVPNEKDILWGLSFSLIQPAMKANDWGKLSRIYFVQADHIRDEGNSPIELSKILHAAEKCNLKTYQSMDVKNVEVLPAPDSCPACLKFKGKKLSIDEAIKEDVLPNKECSNERCRCCYTPLVGEM